VAISSSNNTDEIAAPFRFTSFNEKVGNDLSKLFHYCFTIDMYDAKVPENDSGK
jgi:hypothetical protein